MFRMTAAAVAVAVPAFLATACGSSGENNKQYVRGVSAEAPATGTPTVDIRNLFVLGAAHPDTVEVGGRAALYAYLTAAKADTLVSVASPAFTEARVGSGGGVALPAGKLVDLRAGDKPAVVLTEAVRRLRGGQHVAITLSFAHAGKVTVNAVPVVAHRGYYATYPPAG